MDTQKTLSHLSFSLQQSNAHFGHITVTIPQNYVEKLYLQASEEQKNDSHVYGFSRGEVPLAYIEKNFQPHILEHIKEFFFKYFVINWLYNELYLHKVFFAGEPRLTTISIMQSKDALFGFSISLIPALPLQGWKRLVFKAPKRKNYKDLDRQVENFLKEEEEASVKALNPNIIDIGDWIHFSVTLLNKNKEPMFEELQELLWLKIGYEEADAPFQTLFVGKKIGDSFITNHYSLQEYFSSHLDTHYFFSIIILDHLSSKFFCIEHFKRHFRIKTSKDLHLKFIEVFSYRNDISQRRAISQDALKLLLTKHNFSIPAHLVLRQEKTILEVVSNKPDYHVYKIQPDFKEKIKLLAEKQLKEHVLMRQLAIIEGIQVSTNDIKGYLNLMNRSRTSDFIYFEPPTTKFLGKEMPLSAALLIECCLKEKTLNHAIYHLSKQKS